MRTFLRVIKVTAAVAVFLLLLAFAVRNTDGVTVRYLLSMEWQAPLVFVLLVFFAIGIAFGVMASLGVIVRQRRQILGLTRELRGRTRAAAAPALADPVQARA